MYKARIVFLSVAAACGYGVVHDQITVRLCREYFTVAHLPLFQTRSTTLLALYSGVTATAGIGALLGFVLARVCHAGAYPPCRLSYLFRQVSLLLGIMSVSAVTMGIVGYCMSHFGVVGFPARFAAGLPSSQYDRFMAVCFAHWASYFVGFAGSALLCFRVWTARGRPQAIALWPRTPFAAARAILLGLITAYIIWARFGA